MKEEKILSGAMSSSLDNADIMPQKEKSEAQKIKSGICPSCGGTLVFQEGCKVCYGCGWGGCG